MVFATSAIDERNPEKNLMQDIEIFSNKVIILTKILNGEKV